MPARHYTAHMLRAFRIESDHGPEHHVGHGRLGHGRLGRGRSGRALAAWLSVLLALGAACPDERKDLPATSALPNVEAQSNAPAASDAPPVAGAPTSLAPAFSKQAFSKETFSKEAFSNKAKGKRITILYTGSVQGYVAPCGCTAEPLGGIARLAAVIDEARVKHEGQVLFVDAGNLLFEKIDDHAAADVCQTKARHELLISTYARKGLIATTLGPLDDVRGAAWRDELLEEYDITTLIANPSRKLAAGRSAQNQLQKLGDVVVGLTGVRVDTAAEVPGAVEALSDHVAQLKKGGADVIVVLSQAKRRLTRAMAGESSLSDVDVFILGRDPGEKPVAPERIGPSGPILVASGIQGQHLGVLEFELAGRQGPLALDDRMAGAARRARLLRARVKQYRRRVEQESAGPNRDFIAQKLRRTETELDEIFERAQKKPPPSEAHVTARSIALVRGADEEAEAKAALAAYEAAIPALVRTCEATVECEEPAANAPSFVGVQACYQCHQAAVKFWREQKVEIPFQGAAGKSQTRSVGHSKAWQTLLDGNKASDRTCVGCHSVGFMVPGGYCKTSEVGFLKNVQCEACHGAGSNHVAAQGGKESLAIQDVTEATCRGCHHVPHIPTAKSFVFEDKLLKILGPGHGKVRHDAIKRHQRRP